MYQIHVQSFTLNEFTKKEYWITQNFHFQQFTSDCILYSNVKNIHAFPFVVIYQSEAQNEKKVIDIFPLISLDPSNSKPISEAIYKLFLQHYPLNDKTYPLLMYSLKNNTQFFIENREFSTNPFDDKNILQHTNGYVLYFQQLYDLLKSYTPFAQAEAMDIVRFVKNINIKLKSALEELEQLKLNDGQTRFLEAFPIHKTIDQIYPRYWFDIPMRISNVAYYERK
jgi:hypothetical protein